MSKRVISPDSSDRKSRRITSEMALLALDETPTKAKVNFAEEAIYRGRKQHKHYLSCDFDNEADDLMKETVAYMMRVGVRDKTGYLQKQSKLLGRYNCANSIN